MLETSALTTIATTTPPGRSWWLVRLARALARRIAANRRRRAEQVLISKLSHYDAHLLRDMGLNPADIERSFQNRNMSLLFNPLPPGERN
jgi:uncharacterized protein YjiS (DUF1127 family)